MLNVEFITGKLGNGFIAVVNIMDWVKRRKISSVDQILTALAISRFTVLWFLHLMNVNIINVPRCRSAYENNKTD